MSPYFISCWIFNRWFCHAKLAHWLFEVHEEHFIRACSFKAWLITRYSNPSTLWNMLKSYLFKCCLAPETSIKRIERELGAEFSRFLQPMMMMVENAICMHVITLPSHAICKRAVFAASTTFTYREKRIITLEIAFDSQTFFCLKLGLTKC